MTPTTRNRFELVLLRATAVICLLWFVAFSALFFVGIALDIRHKQRERDAALIECAP